MDLVGGIPTPLKNMTVNWDDYNRYMEKIKMFQTTNQWSNLKLLKCDGWYPSHRQIHWQAWFNVHFRNLNLEVPTRCKAYTRPMKGNVPTKYGLIWYSTYIQGSWNSHWMWIDNTSYVFPMVFRFSYHQTVHDQKSDHRRQSSIPTNPQLLFWVARRAIELCGR